MANVASFLILLLFLYGRSLRFTNLRWHIRLMLIAFAADMVLIAGLVFGRQALGKVSMEMSFALKIHVPIAIFTVVLYFAAIWCGYKLYHGLPVRTWLRRVDKWLLFFRVMTLVTSVWVQFDGV